MAECSWRTRTFRVESGAALPAARARAPARGARCAGQAAAAPAAARPLQMGA
jgi:hypothetical protein